MRRAIVDLENQGWFLRGDNHVSVKNFHQSIWKYLFFVIVHSHSLSTSLTYPRSAILATKITLKVNCCSTSQINIYIFSQMNSYRFIKSFSFIFRTMLWFFFRQNSQNFTIISFKFKFLFSLNIFHVFFRFDQSKQIESISLQQLDFIEFE